jgi:two-component system, chemotaxis family, CheB/CheR fusion protein
MTDSKAWRPQTNPSPDDPETLEEFEVLLAYLKQSRGVDFSAYKRSSLMRRVLVRMQTIGIQGFARYQDYLQVDPDEFVRLFNTILINVTAFFRDPPAWEYLAETVIPNLLEAAAPVAPIRVWSAGCASGEEAYTIAMLLAEALGREQFRERVKIYATDIDDEALLQARQAVYDTRAVQGVPPELLEKYFERKEDRYTFDKELRRSVIFGRHDLIQDAPISRVNLLVCRNCLMYFNTEAQARILARFHFALVDRGVLFLGKAETLLTHATTFTAVDVKRRLFSKVDRAPWNDRPGVVDGSRAVATDEQKQLESVAAEVLPLSHAVVDLGGTVVHLSQQIRTLFGLSPRDIGRPLQDLEISYRPFELRSSIEQSYTERRSVSQKGGRWTSPTGQLHILDLLVVPLPDGSGGHLGASIAFTDVTQQHRLQEEVQRTTQELETALEELQSTNEELETTNEELQSTVEELETTNEELQSTNEELETMNEELQSTNEELQTINDDSRDRSSQLTEVNAFLESILGSLRSAVVMLDRDLYVHKWSPRAEELWGLRSDEVIRKNFLNLDSGLPVEQLRSTIRACLNGEASHTEVMLDATNRRGKQIFLRVTCTPMLAAPDDPPRGVVLLMEEADDKSSAAVAGGANPR